MQFPEIQTDRLALRQLTPQTFDYIFTHLNEVEQLAFLGLKSQEDLDKQKQKFNKGLSTHNRSFLYFQLLEKASRNVIGWCGYHTWYTDHFRAELGYELFDDEFKQRGLMSEAIVPIVKYGFNTMKLHRIEAMVGTFNKASLRLLEKMNFSYEGHLREHYFRNGVAEDSLIYSLLTQEFKR